MTKELTPEEILDQTSDQIKKLVEEILKIEMAYRNRRTISRPDETVLCNQIIQQIQRNANSLDS